MLFVHGMGHFHPPQVIDNAFLESLDIGTTEEWILDNVGIRTRRTVLPLDYIAETRNADPRAARAAVSHSHAECAAQAAYMALDRAGRKPDDIGLVISGSSTTEIGTPAEACAIAGRLGIDAPAFDLNSACTTFATQLHHLMNTRPGSLPDYILLTTPETTTPVLDYNQKESAVLFGDATAAAVVSVAVPARVQVRATTFSVRPRDWERVVMPTGGYFRQDGRVMQKFAVKQTQVVYREMDAHLRDASPPPFFVAQQASMSLLQTSCMITGVAEAQHWYNADEFGNCGCAGAPTVLSQRWDDLAAGDQVIVALAGAGLSWGGFLLDVAMEESA